MKTNRANETPLPKPYYQDGACTIYHGDCRKLLPLLPPGLTATDVPYNQHMRYEDFKDNLPLDEYHAMLRTACRKPCVLIHYPEQMFDIAINVFGQRPEKVMAWVYPANTARQFRLACWWGIKPDFRRARQPYRNPKDKRIAARIARGEQAQAYDWMEVNLVKNVTKGKNGWSHPCPIPVAVMQRIIEVTEARLVIDPFAGSGSTLIAAKRLGVPSVGIEMSEKYCEIAARRCEQERGRGWLLEASPSCQVSLFGAHK